MINHQTPILHNFNAFLSQSLRHGSEALIIMTPWLVATTFPSMRKRESFNACATSGLGDGLTAPVLSSNDSDT